MELEKKTAQILWTMTDAKNVEIFWWPPTNCISWLGV